MSPDGGARLSRCRLRDANLAQPSERLDSAIMGTAVAIHGSNSGLQVGINHGLISAEFHFPPGMLRDSSA